MLHSCRSEHNGAKVDLPEYESNELAHLWHGHLTRLGLHCLHLQGLDAVELETVPFPRGMQVFTGRESRDHAFCICVLHANVSCGSASSSVSGTSLTIVITFLEVSTGVSSKSPDSESLAVQAGSHQPTYRLVARLKPYQPD